MDGITWTDVRATIPQPLQAHNVDSGARQAELRLWYTPAAEKPYKVEVRLLESGQLTETWTVEYTSGRGGGFNRAQVAYTDARGQVGWWLVGAPISKCRPGRPWAIAPDPHARPK